MKNYDYNSLLLIGKEYLMIAIIMLYYYSSVLLCISIIVSPGANIHHMFCQHFCCCIIPA